MGSPKPRYSWLSGVPFLSLRFRPPSGGREEPKSEARRAEMLAFGRGFFVRCAGPRGLRAPWNPRQGPPLHRTPYKRLPATPWGAFAEGQGCRGKSAPDTLPAGLGRSGRVKGPCPRPCGAAGRTNPLTRPPLEKRARGPRRGLRGTVGGMGVKARAATAQRLGLDAQERPQRLGWWLGVLFPQPPATWRTPRRPPEALLICSCFALFRRNT